MKARQNYIGRLWVKSSHVDVLERNSYSRFGLRRTCSDGGFPSNILELAGIEIPAGLETDGVSLKTIIETGTGEAHSSLFGELGYSRAVKTKDWKYIAVRYPEDLQDAIDRG